MSIHNICFAVYNNSIIVVELQNYKIAKDFIKVAELIKIETPIAIIKIKSLKTF